MNVSRTLVPRPLRAGSGVGLKGCAHDEVELGGFDFNIKAIGTAGLAIRLRVIVRGHCPNSLFAVGMHKGREFIAVMYMELYSNGVGGSPFSPGIITLRLFLLNASIIDEADIEVGARCGSSVSM